MSIEKSEYRVQRSSAELRPVTPDALAELHFAKIQEAEKLGAERATCSTTEAIMVALALCDRRYLPAHLREVHVRELRGRLDISQKAALERYSRGS
jgi:hypothetical protein